MCAASALRRLVVAGVPVIERPYAPGEQVYLRGDADRGLCFLLEGTIRLYKVYGSFQEATLGLLEDGGLFGEPYLQPEGRHRDSAEAVSYCRVIRAPKGPLEAHFGRDPLCRAALIRALCEWAEEREATVARLLERKVDCRLARLLLEMSGRFGRETERGTEVCMRLTHQDLARMIACRRGSISKEMIRFQRAGLTESRGPGRLVVLDKSKLGEIARGGNGEEAPSTQPRRRRILGTSP